MRRTPRIRPTAAVSAAIWAVIGAVVLAGCGAGQVSQTARQVTAVDGANATTGTIAVRNAQFVLPEGPDGAVAYARGASAPLEATIINTGGTGDELVAISSPVAGSGVISGKRDIPAGQSVTLPGEAAAETTATATPAAAPTATPAAGPATTPAAATATPAAAPDGSTKVVLTGLRDDIRSGLTYEVVLTFRNAGSVRLAVPVAGSTAERKDEHAE